MHQPWHGRITTGTGGQSWIWYVAPEFPHKGGVWLVTGRSERAHTAPADPVVFTVRLLTILVLAVASVVYISYSIHWTMTADTPVMHYVVFLMRHGFRPYAEITDNNMPGAYLTEAAAMRLFGPGDVGWRLYEFTLLALLTGCAAYLTRHVDPVAGIFAGGVFVALHAGEGPQFAAERELVITVLLLLACVALEWSITQAHPAWMLAAGVSGGLAVSIKPTFLLFVVLLLLTAAWVLHRRTVPALLYMLWALCGLACVALLCLGFLLYYKALPCFLFVLTKVIPAYVGAAPPGWASMVRAALPRSILAVTILVLPLAVANRSRPRGLSWQYVVLAFGAATGLLSFFAQRKGFPHHRYTFLVFLLLLVAMELFKALRRRGWMQIWASVVIAGVLFGFVPRSVRAGGAIPRQTELLGSLRSDLRTLGGPTQLQNKVFCFDLIYGCLNALYHEDLVESAPYTGDLLLFQKNSSPASEYYRDRFWKLLGTTPPEVLVLTNQDLLGEQGFDRLKLWPAFDSYLHGNYTEVLERRFPHEKFGVSHADVIEDRYQDRYRLYIHNGSPLLQRGLAALAAPRAGQPAPNAGAKHID